MNRTSVTTRPSFGGTGRFAGATGDVTNIGEVDLVKGTVFRYSGQICFADHDE